MLLLVLFGVVSLVAGQCSNTVSNPGCCQSANYGPTFSGPYSIFNVANIGYGQSYTMALAGSRAARRSCFNTKAINVLQAELAAKQPIYSRVLRDNPTNRLIDNTCTTFFPLPDNPDTYLIYRSTVYTDGSHDVSSRITTNIAPGIFIHATPHSTVQENYFSSIGNDVLISCTQGIYGKSDVQSDIFVKTLDLAPLAAACLNGISQIISCNGKGGSGLYVLPYRLPTQCITRQICTLPNPLLRPGIYPGLVLY